MCKNHHDVGCFMAFVWCLNCLAPVTSHQLLSLHRPSEMCTGEVDPLRIANTQPEGEMQLVQDTDMRFCSNLQELLASPRVLKVPLPHSRSPTSGPSANGPIPALIHQTGPKDTSKWDEWTKSMNVTNFTRRFYRDEDLPAIVQEVAPDLYGAFLNFSDNIEKVDFARYAVLYRDGGIYCDLDIELKDVNALKSLMASNKVTLPFENDRMVGQSFMISPPRHPFMLEVMEYLVKRYNPACYATMNTGPDALTEFWLSSGGCDAHKKDIQLSDGVLTGKIAQHHHTWSWANDEQMKKRSGFMGCSLLCGLCRGDCERCLVKDAPIAPNGTRE
eukprot:gnl/TRDRNA2_/TRDRNA2_92881_c0_seq2.p1 gnl/TRDRNA2_/TRDRNA2_92881_c0~~gnl/TRDRNA2_/TRDRNA2_92881_c0_seq2.p1  ORF type:complete len:331 (+),score=32.29 gnl/TRDRNA2_/TRDRNA2_92881_c0_seq2:1-993(+)